MLLQMVPLLRLGANVIAEGTFIVLGSKVISDKTFITFGLGINIFANFHKKSDCTA